MEQTEYIPDDSRLSPSVSVQGTIKAGVSCKKLTPLMFDSEDSASLIVWDGTAGKAIALSARSIVESTAEQTAVIYVGGGFRMNFIAWPDSVTTDKQKRAAFLGSSVFVDDEY